MRQKMGEKGQGLPLNTIILALLGLAVMVLLFAALTGRLGGFFKATAECPGRCAPYETLPAHYVTDSKEGCIADIEVEQSGRYVERGSKGAAVPKKCDACCLRLV